MPKKTAPLGFAREEARKLSEQFRYMLVDVELVKEPTGRFLRFFIDKEGGITLSDCEAFHRKIQPLMEKVDYDYMEVCSPGADRPLTQPADFERARGEKVEVRLYRPHDGRKVLTGELVGRQDGMIVILGADGERIALDQKQVALVKPLIEFDEDDLMDDEGEE